MAQSKQQRWEYAARVREELRQLWSYQQREQARLEARYRRELGDAGYERRTREGRG